MNDQEVGTLFGAVVAECADNPRDCEFISAKDLYTAAMAAGLDMTRGDPNRRSDTLKAISRSFAALTPEGKYRALVTLTSTLHRTGTVRAARLAKILAEFRCSWDGNHVVPVGVLDERESQLLPRKSASEIAKAVDRLASGDESGAIGSACGAVDLVTGAAYEKFGLGDPGKSSFSTKVNTALDRLGVFDKMRDEFAAIGMDAKEAADATKHLSETMNHAAQALQVLRKRMGDVHGTRPALKSTAYDCIKFASAICALFEGYV